MVKVRIDHPIARCLELSDRLRDLYGLDTCEVVPSLSSVSASGMAVSLAAANLIERWLLRQDPLILGLGTGRSLRGAIDYLPRISCDQHKVVSLTGNIAPDGSTAYYNVLFTITDKVTAPTYPMPLPVIAASREERDVLLSQTTLAKPRSLARETDIRFLGVGTVTETAPLLLDGFITRADQERLVRKGAVGEIIGWVFDSEGQLLDDELNDRVSSAGLSDSPGTPKIAAAHGPDKVPAIRAALAGGLINGLITDEDTAIALT
jgi:DNA-binding transcriptional regulator LsrR (DeoR family)